MKSTRLTRGAGSLLALLFSFAIGAALSSTATAQGTGQALNFDSANDYVSMAPNSAFDFVDGTVELWARPTYSPRPDHPQLVSNRSASGTRWSYHMAGNLSGLLLWNGSLATQVDFTFTLGTWYHIAFVESGATTTFYVNGASIGSINSTSGTTTGLPVNIGGISGGERFQGDLDEVRIWNVARTPAQIAGFRFFELSGSEPGLVGLYHFNQGTAGGNNAGVTTAIDAAGGDNNGTLFNFALAGNTSNWIAPGAIIYEGEIDLQGNGLGIANGDTSPSLADHTHYGLVFSATSLARTFTIQNSHPSENLTVTLVETTGPNASEFAVSGITFPATIAPGASTTFTVTLNSSTIAPRLATVRVYSSDADEPGYNFQVRANGLGEINVQGNGANVLDGDLSPAIADGTYFGMVASGATVSRAFTIQNLHGSEDLAIETITLSGANASEFAIAGITLPVTLPAGASTTFNVVLNATSNLPRGAVVNINNSDLDEFAYDFAVSANGLSSSVNVGAGSDYPSLTGAGGLFSAINAGGLSGNLTVNITSDLSEDGANALQQWSEIGGGNYTVTIQPDSATLRTISGNVAVAGGMIRLDGADRVTIDGRFGGSGKWLTFSNTNTSQPTLTFINDASGNTIKNVTLQGVSPSAASGTVLFSTTTGANGNDNNTIDTCDIRDGATTPAKAIYAVGSTGTTAQNNSGNTVSNCNIFNFYDPTTLVAGINLDGGNTDWTITGNSFYQTASRAAAANQLWPIYCNNPSSGNNFTITGNFIGGSAPSAGGAAWTTTGTSAAYQFQGIRLNVGTTTASSVQGNTIRNIVWTSSNNSSALPAVWTGIYVNAGSANIGTVAGNTIGSGTGTGSISVTTSGTGGTTFGIGSTSSGTVAIANNTIGSITANGSTSTTGTSIVGIQVTAGTNTISGNTIGSTTTANSLNAATAITGAATQNVSGIITTTSSTSANITGNTVANLNNNCAGTFGAVRGISTSTGVNTITGNTVRNLSNAAATPSATTGQSVYGIIQTSTTAGQTVSQNVVHSLSNTNGSAAISLTGIYYAGAPSGTNTIARNFVHSLSVSSSHTSSAMNGMQFAAGTFTAQNNMVRVGLDATGASAAGASTVRGIYDNGTTAGRNFYHNSVYIGGTQTASGATVSSVALGGVTGVSNARAYQNNIFVNTRTTSGGTGKHYAVLYGGTTVNPTGLTAGGNIFFVSGTGGVLGLYNGADRATLVAWQAATGQDASSAFVDPQFVNPTGTSATVDLHLSANNPAEMGGLPLAVVTDDYDGETRSGLTPTDIGADAGNFTSSSGDIFAPSISYTPLSVASTANRVLTGFATITDNSGTVSGGASSPRLYFKKSTDADVFGGNTSADDGWKYVAASNASSPYDFTIDYSIINGGSVSAGNAIQYFVVAQDAANNLGSSPAGATASANPPVQNINAHGGVNSYNILGTLSGTKTVGAGGDYPTLTGAGGFFAAINNSILTGNLVISITGDLTEDGTNVLNQWFEEGAGNYTLTIQPADGTMKTISGTVAAGMMRLNGADRVTIDGRFGGAGRFLTFRNSSTSNPTITLFNDASNNTIRSSVIEGASTGNSVIFILTGATTGNDNNTITDNQVRDLSTAAGVPFSLIVSQGTSASVANSNNTISNNELFNFTGNAVQISGTNSGNESWLIQGNTIYQTADRTTFLNGIRLEGSTGTISQNIIRDLNTTNSVSAIFISGSKASTITRNRVYSIQSPTGTTGDITGIEITSGSAPSTTIVNNQFSLIPTATGNRIIRGIRDEGTGTTNVYYNSVVIGGTSNGGNNTWAFYRRNASTATLRDNIFFNDRTGGTGSHFAAGNQSATGTFSSNYNLFVGTGATAANFMDSGTISTGTPVSFAAWQSSTGGDANSNAGNPGGNFTTSMFVDPTVGDLHIVAAGNPLVSNTGTPISGVTTDFDGQTRSASTPDIGADEFGANNNTAPTISAATGVTRQQGSALSNSTIATVNDSESGAGSLTVTATTVPTGLTVSNIANNNGTITADIAASCTAAAGNNTVVMEVSDGSLTATANLIVNVTANSAPALSYTDPAAVVYGGAATVNPATASDNGAIASFAVQSQGTYTGTISVNNAGAVSLSNAAPAGTHTITIRATDNCGSVTDASFTLTVNRKAVTVTADGKTKVKGAADPAFTYVATGLVGSDTLSGSLTRSPGEGPGSYLIQQGTVTDANNPNYAITYVAANLVITGPIAGNDAVTRTAGSPNSKFPLATLLANDSRIDASGASQTDNLSITGASAGTGNSVSISGAFVFYTPSNPSLSDPLTFTYTLTDAVSGATDTGTVTVTTVAAAPFALSIVEIGRAIYDSGSDTTSITMGFITVPNTSLNLEYSTNMSDWIAYTSNPANSGATGSFAVTFTAPGDQTAAWNTGMFFRATRQ